MDIEFITDRVKRKWIDNSQIEPTNQLVEH